MGNLITNIIKQKKLYLLIYVNLIGNIIANFDSFFLYQIFSRYFELKIFMII